EITVASGARLVVRGQSATKLYPCGPGESSRICANYNVEANAELVVLPSELIPFKDATFNQTSEASLAAGARLVIGEIITPGRIAMGERNEYRRLDLRLKIRRAEWLVLLDRTLLEPSTHD